MSDDLVTIATFMSNAEASPARTALETVGIRTYLQGGTTADMLSHIGTGLGGVKLQVAAADCKRAVECLGLSRTDDEASEQEPWTCHQCGAQVDGGFEICWSCGTEFDEQAATTSNESPPAAQENWPTSTVQPSITCPMCGQNVDVDEESCPHCGEPLGGDADNKPAADLDEDEIPEHVRHAEELLGRAFRASIIGCALCPPLLNIYSILQLVEFEAARREYYIKTDWRLPTTYVINTIVILFEVALILYFFR